MPIVRRNKGDKPATASSSTKTEGIKKRIPAKEKLIYTSKEGVLVVKTPALCTKWPTPFRMRLVSDYVAPRTLMSVDAYARKFVDTGYQDEVYRINKIDIRIRQPAELLQNSRHLVVLRTEVCNISQNRCMYLYHDEPAMRVLMTYAFLFGKVIPGMPKLDIYDYIP